MRTRRGARWIGLVAAILVAAAARGPTAAPRRTFEASLDRVWTVTESVLREQGWDVDKADRAVGWLLTDSRGVEVQDYAVYGKGTRHKLRLSFKAVGPTRTALIVEREVYTEERILWMTDRKAVRPADTHVETALLDAVAKFLP